MNKLFTEFPQISTEQWLETIRTDLKGKDIEKLLRKTIDGLEFKPFYRKEDIENLPTTGIKINEFPYIRGTKENQNWKIRQEFLYTNKQELRNKINIALDKNVDIIGLDFGEEKQITFEELKILTENIKGLALSSFKNIEDYYDFITKLNLDSGFLNFDPITYYAFVGKHYKDEKQIWDNVQKLLLNPIKNIKTVGINVKSYANAGASPIMQLAFALSIAQEYFNFSQQKNIPLEKVLSNIHFNFSVGTEYFMEIAKLRSFKYLFAKFVEAYGEKYKSFAKAFVHVTTSRRNKSIYDAHINMLRTTIEGLAASVAGVDSITIEPYNVVFSTTDNFSERISLNQQIILKEEAYIDKVVDPSGGSYYIEKLSVELISKAWDLFLKIQEQGGFCEALRNNFISSLVYDISKKEKNLVNTGQISILGINKYPNWTENLKDLIVNKPINLSDFAIENPDFNLLKESRLSEDFEELRMNIEKSKLIPKVFLLTFGNASMRRARADFAGNFFAVAGYEIIDNLGFETVDEGIESAKNQNVDIVVLCSSDDSYLEASKKIIEKINDKKIVIAGNPNSRNEIEKLGINHFIHTKSNIFNELKNI